MLRLLITVVFFLLSLLVVVPIPFHALWFPALAFAEFPWVAVVVAGALLVWAVRRVRFRVVCVGLSGVALLLAVFTIGRAYRVASDLDARLDVAFGVKTGDIGTPHRDVPFSFWRMVGGVGGRLPFETFQYSAPEGYGLDLHYYRSKVPGVRPCLLIVHGGSWRSGDAGELGNVSSYFSTVGYNVASIDYRLAPAFKSPAPVADVAAAIGYLQGHAGELGIDTGKFVLMGRSAGGQIVLAAAYTLHLPCIKGVVSFYGPTDMVLAYEHSDNPLVLDSHGALQDFTGGTPGTAPGAYAAAAPINFVTAQTVPTLLVHSPLDAHVQYEQSVVLDAKLQAVGVPHLLLTLPWTTHGCEFNINGPSGQLSIYAIEHFLWAVTGK